MAVAVVVPADSIAASEDGERAERLQPAGEPRAARAAARSRPAGDRGVQAAAGRVEPAADCGEAAAEVARFEAQPQTRGSRARAGSARRSMAPRSWCVSSAAWRPRMATRAGKPASPRRLARTCTPGAAALEPGGERRPQPARLRSSRAPNSSFAAMTISAAADGVGARRSATKSAIVKSTSCPPPRRPAPGTRRSRARRVPR